MKVHVPVEKEGRRTRERVLGELKRISGTGPPGLPREKGCLMTSRTRPADGSTTPGVTG